MTAVSARSRPSCPARRPERLFADWTQPYPEPLDYSLADIELNAPGAAADQGNDGAFIQRFSILRTSGRPVGEAVEVEVQGRGDDERTRVIWNDDRPRTDLSIATPWRARRTLLDPDRRLL